MSEKKNPDRGRLITSLSDMNKPIKLTNLIQSGKYYDLRHAIYWPKGCAPALTAAMGMGGGFVPLLVVIK